MVNRLALFSLFLVWAVNWSAAHVFAQDGRGVIASNGGADDDEAERLNWRALESSISPSIVPSAIPSSAPSDAPSTRPSTAPSNAPSTAPSNVPSTAPSNVPSTAPSNAPRTTAPSNVPSTAPSNAPSKAPSNAPSNAPGKATTTAPSDAPSKAPSNVPSKAPSNVLSSTPSNAPSVTPSKQPSKAPLSPSKAPSPAPSKTPSTAPSRAPSASPNRAPVSPSVSPTSLPTTSPSKSPSSSPSRTPSRKPTSTPSKAPSDSPSGAPSTAPTSSPSRVPSRTPSNSPTTTAPSQSPSRTPSNSPSKSPSSSPTRSPTLRPTHSPSRSPSKSPSAAPTTSAPSSAPSTTPTTSRPSLAPSFSPTTSAPSAQPTVSPLPFRSQNVVLIIVDDLKASVGSFGDPDAITPNMDKLGTYGMRFTNHHVQVSECAPSRACALTGRRPDQLQLFGRQPHFRNKNENLMTMPAHFRQLGYKVVAIGKVFDQASFTDSKDYDNVVTDLCGEDDPPSSTSCSFDIEQPALHAAQDQLHCPLGAQQFPPLTNKPSYTLFGEVLNPYQESDRFLDSCLAYNAIARLDEFAQEPEKNFFLAIGFLRPHLPWSAPREYWDLFPKKQEKAFANKIWAKDIPGANFFRRQSSAASHRKGWDELKMFKGKREPVRRPRAYYATVAFIDSMIGKVVDHIQNHHVRAIRDETIIVVWGDNGLHLGQGLWGKKTLFEQATRTPLIVVPSASWYQSQQVQGRVLTGVGRAISFPVESVDIYPTIIEMAGVDHLNVPFAGMSLAPYFFNQLTPLKPVAVSQYADQRKKFRTKRMGYSLRSENYRLIVYVKWDPRCLKKNRGCAFYNTFINNSKKELYYYPYPGAKETVNVFKDKKHEAARIFLATLLREKDIPFSNNKY